MSELNRRALELITDQDRVNVLSDFNLYFVSWAEKDGTTYLVSEQDGVVKAVKTISVEGRMGKKQQQIVYSYEWNSQSPEDISRQKYGDFVGFGPTQIDDIDRTVLAVERQFIENNQATRRGSA